MRKKQNHFNAVMLVIISLLSSYTASFAASNPHEDLYSESIYIEKPAMEMPTSLESNARAAEPESAFSNVPNFTLPAKQANARRTVKKSIAD